MKLVLFSKDWADEFNCDGFKVMSDDEWERYKTRAETAHSFQYNFGTNEGWEDDYDTPADVLQYDITAKDITIDEAAVIEKLFGKLPYGYGIFPDSDAFVNDEDDANDD